MSRMQWDREQRNDRVRTHGSEPAWVDATERDDETEESRLARDEIARLALDDLVREFQRLPREDRADLLESFSVRMSLTLNERRMALQASERRRYESALRHAEEIVRAQLREAVPRSSA